MKRHDSDTIPHHTLQIADGHRLVGRKEIYLKPRNGVKQKAWNKKRHTDCTAFGSGYTILLGILLATGEGGDEEEEGLSA